MNLYSRKQRWKIILFLTAVVIILTSLWYSQYIASEIKEREKGKVELWSAAVQKRTELVNITANLFENLKEEERTKAKLWAQGYNILAKSPLDADIDYVFQVVSSNTSIPVLLVNEQDSIYRHRNVDSGCASDYECLSRLKKKMARKNEPIEFSLSESIKHYIYYNDSKIFTDLKETLEDLKNTFITETVVNSASVPVILTDHTKTKVLAFGSVDSLEISDSLNLKNRLLSMNDENEPIELEIVGSGKQYIYYEDSYILKLLKYFPIIQLTLIGLFLFVAYMIFSTFRKAEQNQVWVGMAKETAHQLGTPLSSLMAWMTLLEEEDIDDTIVVEMTKDITRLNTVTDRFSKIGSTPELIQVDLNEIVGNSVDYLKTRLSRKVDFTFNAIDGTPQVKISKPLFSWVLENLFKNSVDAMNGEGKINVHISESSKGWEIDISDTGKGIPKSSYKTVFEPGYTTKKRGWGLGLSLTKRIVEEYHDGKILVLFSEIDKGTTFRIIMPKA